MKIRILSALFVFFWALATSIPAFAGDLVVTRYFSGLWDQTHHESQGIVLQIIDQEEEGNPKAVAYWFTYGDDLETAWYMAIGRVEGDQVLMELYSSSGAGFMQEDSEDINPVEASGTLVLTFKNCNKGTASYTMGDDGGEFDISRLASLYNSRCSGGISDNTPGDAKPLIMDVELLPPGDGMVGKGKARFWQRSDRMDLHVSVEGLPDGEYEIEYCGEVHGPLTVFESEGAAQFRSPEAEGKILLTKDPRDCQFNIQQGIDPVVVHLTSGENVLAEKQKGPKDKGEMMKISLELENISTIESAEGEVEYEIKMNETVFEVEIKGVPAATYGFFVGGTQHGSIEVMIDGEKSKLKFSDPQKEDWEPLTFEPWDQIIEVRDGANLTLLEVTFPSA